MKNTDQHIVQNVNSGPYYVNQPDEISLFDVFDILLKFKWLFMVSFCVILAVGIFVVHRLPAKYRYTQYISIPSYVDVNGITKSLVDLDGVVLAIQQMVKQDGTTGISVSVPIVAGSPSQFSDFLQLTITGHMGIHQVTQQMQHFMPKIQAFFQPKLMRKKQALLAQKHVLSSQLAVLEYALPSQIMMKASRSQNMIRQGMGSFGQFNMSAQLQEVNTRLENLKNIQTWGPMTLAKGSEKTKKYALVVFLALFMACIMVFIAQFCSSYMAWRKRDTHL